MGACHVSAHVSFGHSISQAAVEHQAAVQLQKEVDIADPPTIKCPGDLEAKVGATIECTLTTKDYPNDVYQVHIVVTKVKGNDASFDIKVADQPN
jgi:hypothetical protein